MSELKPCPYRVYGERRASLTVAGEFYYNEYFAPCIERECDCFRVDCGDAYCTRNGAYMKLGELEKLEKFDGLLTSEDLIERIEAMK